MRVVRKLLLSLLTIPFVFSSAAQAPAQPQSWTVQTTGIATNLRGVSAVHGTGAANPSVVWASGSNGVILQSVDGGQNWKRLHVLDDDTLDFRGIRAFDEKTAYVISSGDGDKSRIYKTTDGGLTWEMQYTDKRPGFFLDDIACFTETHCFVLGDPIDGKFLILATEDGKTWHDLPRDNMPAIITGEGAFAASGTSLAIYGKSDIYFGTGGGATARVFHSSDLGRTWTVSETPLAAGNPSSGVFSVLRIPNAIIVTGGDYRVANGTSRVAAFSTDGGATWQLATSQPGGYRSTVAVLDGSTLVCAGPNGEDISTDAGKNWAHTDSTNLNSIVVLDAKNAWAAGARGTIAHYSNEKPH
jgi:photosystem II stability/assembly factor-like uncharacterized protein